MILATRCHVAAVLPGLAFSSLWIDFIAFSSVRTAREKPCSLAGAQVFLVTKSNKGGTSETRASDPRATSRARYQHA